MGRHGNYPNQSFQNDRLGLGVLPKDTISVNMVIETSSKFMADKVLKPLSYGNYYRFLDHNLSIFSIKHRNWTTRATEMDSKAQGQMWRSVIEKRNASEVNNDKAALFLHWSSVCAAHSFKENVTEKEGHKAYPKLVTTAPRGKTEDYRGLHTPEDPTHS